MSDQMIECTEVAGKTVSRLRLVSSESGSHEVHLEFTDATAFSLTVEPAMIRKAQLIFQSEGATETLRSYGE
jgi:hypothetical protein